MNLQEIIISAIVSSALNKIIEYAINQGIYCFLKKNPPVGLISV